MQAFDLNHDLIRNYEEFSRSFTKIRAPDLSVAVNNEYESSRFWPDSLISLNPAYKSVYYVSDLVDSGNLHSNTGKIFQINEKPIRLYLHQSEAIAKAKKGQSFVVTTGTGSGKSLCFFIPIVDAIIRDLADGRPHRTRAIIVYPMNALANSQLKEIEKFLEQSGLPKEQRPIVKRYTGQESPEERREIAKNPPDILLTNFMMAELLLTRQSEMDQTVIQNAGSLEFVVLDELHTYRGRQGADVAVLIRRLCNRCCPGKTPIFIGTSATMANEGDESSKAAAISSVASRLFGADITPDAIIDESLRRFTDEEISLKQALIDLPESLASPLPESLPNSLLRTYPLAVWVELKLGLSDQETLRRRKPISIADAAKQLSEDSGRELEFCETRLKEFMTQASLPEDGRGGTSSDPFFAFKLHRFVSGAGEIYTTLCDSPRRVLFEGQQTDPENPEHRLYTTRFCRNCGQEFYVVKKVINAQGEQFLTRSIDETPVEDEEGNDAGYLTPQMQPGDLEYLFDGAMESLPEEWREERNGVERIRSYRQKQIPQEIRITPNGVISSAGRRFWYIPGRFRFCPCCHDQPNPSMRERSKLAGLSGEGRSSATTVMVSSALQWMGQLNSTIPEHKRKILAFTDNRQDAALQAGHFNDFLFVSILRGAILRAVQQAGSEGITDSEFGSCTLKALGFTAEAKETRRFWLSEPDSRMPTRIEAQKNLIKVLGYRVWTDLRRGWRYTNPNLTELDLIRTSFLGVDELAKEADLFKTIHPQLALLSDDKRHKLLEKILRFMLQGMAVQTESLDPMAMETISSASRSYLRPPWAIDLKEHLYTRTSMVIHGPRRENIKLSEERLFIRGSAQSRLGRTINRDSVMGTQFSTTEYADIMNQLMRLLEKYDLVVSVDADDHLSGWRLSGNAVKLLPGPALQEVSDQNHDVNAPNPYFSKLYRQIAADLTTHSSSLLGLEGREHTAQVSPEKREWREWRFRYDPNEDQPQIEKKSAEMKQEGEPTEFLPALFCSPTMELGVDISALNTVYLRNVPPTPANYAQRSGRAGRSGQAAVVVTYCAAQSPHDQYFFQRRSEMVAGIVRPPTLDITNEELVRSHLQAVWLAESGLALPPNISAIIDLTQDEYPLQATILEKISRESLVDDCRESMKQIMHSILAAQDIRKPLWLGDLDEFVQTVASEAPDRFDKTFDRWRELYRAALRQKKEANAKIEQPGIRRSEHKKYKAAWIQSVEQIDLLEHGKAINGSDFYSYRYLATEGFLPGYNFPRLPLYAFIPGQKQGAYLQRPRFLAISEFGPRSLIYHEGRAYRVRAAKLPPEARSPDGSALATQEIIICSECGACHSQERERCHACQASLSKAERIKSTLRIDNVEAEVAERITANDEERVRQGFEIQTVFAWPQKNGQIQITQAQVIGESGLKLVLQYANSAEISRINKGLRRRKKETVFGFPIDPLTGYWAKSDDESDDEKEPDIARPERVVPIVQDRKNALLIRFQNLGAYSSTTITTVQHALIRGIEISFQLEEGEILGEPLPRRDQRRALLLYEATEGGAGVLNQLFEDAAALRRVAKVALELMHYDQVEEAISSGDTSLLQENHEASFCSQGCYRCLLSYYNQTDHGEIDRRDEEVKQFLVELARSTIAPVESSSQSFATNTSIDGSTWSAWFKEHDLPLPDSDPKTLADQTFPFVWAYFRILATTDQITAEAQVAAEQTGWQLFTLPETPASGISEELIAALTAV